MKVENQVVSLDLAMRLKELGVNENSLSSHSQYGQTGNRLDWEVWPSDGCGITVPAFTVAELCELMSFALTDQNESVSHSQ